MLGSCADAVASAHSPPLRGRKICCLTRFGGPFALSLNCLSHCRRKMDNHKQMPWKQRTLPGRETTSRMHCGDLPGLYTPSWSLLLDKTGIHIGTFRGHLASQRILCALHWLAAVSPFLFCVFGLPAVFRTLVAPLLWVDPACHWFLPPLVLLTFQEYGRVNGLLREYRRDVAFHSLCLAFLRWL